MKALKENILKIFQLKNRWEKYTTHFSEKWLELRSTKLCTNKLTQKEKVLQGS